LESVLDRWAAAPDAERMPAVFVGHGTPMSAIQPNQWTAAWTQLGQKLPRPKAILAISAHWLTQGGSLVTSSAAPRMNYDMHGFPKPLYEFVYPARGDAALAQEVAQALAPELPMRGDNEWGYDHGTWLVMKYIFPKADVPVIQLSLDYSKPPAFHYDLARRLTFLRSKGILILGSGNIVHNLRWRPGSNNDKPFDWALEFDQKMWANIREGNYRGVADFKGLGNMASLAHPSHDHFLPLLYCLGVATERDRIDAFVDTFQWPAVSMRSLLIA
jgi:4,5-DOPA dioxygenase extradiol